MYITQIKSFECTVVCPSCGNDAEATINEVISGGVCCLECGDDSEFDINIEYETVELPTFNYVRECDSV